MRARTWSHMVESMAVNYQKNQRKLDFRPFGRLVLRYRAGQRVGGSAENRARRGFATANVPKKCNFSRRSASCRRFSTMFSTGVEILGEEPNGTIVCRCRLQSDSWIERGRTVPQAPRGTPLRRSGRLGTTAL